MTRVKKTTKKPMKPTAKKRRPTAIPEFASREEEAKFWDTHSVADHWDELDTVEVRFARNLSQGITVRFDDQTLARLRTQAEMKGIGPTTLIRMWVMERLRADKDGDGERPSNSSSISPQCLHQCGCV